MDMAPEGRGAALHDGVCGSADVDRQGMGLFVGRKRVLEDRV